MPTPAEQKALAFVAFVVLLGGAVRVVKGSATTRPSSPTPTEQQALARQAYAANSSAVATSGQKGGKRRGQPRAAPKRRYAGAKFDSTGVMVEGTGVVSSALDSRGFPPPVPRIDVGIQPSGMAAVPVPPRGYPAQRDGGGPVDLDLADTLQIGRLPRIGPGLARRIVANRDSMGPFGSLSGLGRVRGVGPATLKRLAGLVTFSGQARR